MKTLQIPTPRKFVPLLGKGRYKGAWGGRGSGKSHFFAELLIERCMMIPGTRAVCVREIQRSLKNSVKMLVEDKIRKLGVSQFFEILDAEIRTPGGGIIIFTGLQNHTSDSIKSLEGFDVAWCEEAQSLSQRSLDLLRPTIRKPGSELWFSWNPSKPTDPVDVLLRGESSLSDAIVIEANYSDNPWLPEELRADLEDDRRRDPDKFLHVWGGHYSLNSEARVFRNWTIEEFEPPRDAVFRFGADWGFAIDPTVLVRCYIEGRNLYVDYEAYEVGREIDHLPALFDQIEGSRKWLIRADSARPETVSYMRRQGFRITPALKGQGSVEDGVEFLRSFDIKVHPRCVKVAEELTLYSYKVDPHTQEILPFLADKNNHCIAEGVRVWTRRGHVPIEAVRVDDEVMTRVGWRRVLWAGMTDANRETIMVNGLQCTPDHEIYTHRGFVRADALRYDDELIMEKQAWSRLSNGMVTSGGAIPIAREVRTVTTIGALCRMVNPLRCIGLFGRSIAGLSHRAITSTISTMIQATTRSTISNAFSLRPTSNTMLESAGRLSDFTSKGRILTPSGISQKNGTQAQRAGRCTGAWEVCLMGASNPSISLASNAAQLSRPRSWATWTGSAPVSASRPSAVPQEWTTKIGCVVAAARHLVSTAMRRRKLVRVPVLIAPERRSAAKVYDITVDGQHEFFADGVLVHNCIDALRYGLEELRRSGYKPTAKAKPGPKDMWSSDRQSSADDWRAA